MKLRQLPTIQSTARDIRNRADFVKVAAVGVFALVGFWTLGCGGNGSVSNNYGLSVNRLKAVNLGLVMYMNDYDDVLPLGGKWMDELIPYAKVETDYHSPAVASKGYGYAYNSAIQGQTQTQFATPSTVVTLFDSTDLSRNATDSISTQPIPPRYGSKNTIGYLDGHVQDQDTANGPPPSLYAQSQTRLKQVDLGMIIYSNDYDSTMPLANKWVDEELPYLKNEVLFHSPAVETQSPANYGYALNILTAGQLTTTFAVPASTISFFDSIVLSINATASTSTLPQPPRYKPYNTIAYVDGHVHP